MNVRISDHAKEHMRNCSISEQDVRDLFDEKIPIVKAEQSKQYEECIEIYAILSGEYGKGSWPSRRSLRTIPAGARRSNTNTVTTAFKLRDKQWEKLTKSNETQPKRPHTSRTAPKPKN